MPFILGQWARSRQPASIDHVDALRQHRALTAYTYEYVQNTHSHTTLSFLPPWICEWSVFFSLLVRGNLLSYNIAFYVARIYLAYFGKDARAIVAIRKRSNGASRVVISEPSYTRIVHDAAANNHLRHSEASHHPSPRRTTWCSKSDQSGYPLCAHWV